MCLFLVHQIAFYNSNCSWAVLIVAAYFYYVCTSTHLTPFWFLSPFFVFHLFNRTLFGSRFRVKGRNKIIVVLTYCKSGTIECCVLASKHGRIGEVDRKILFTQQATKIITRRRKRGSYRSSVCCLRLLHHLFVICCCAWPFMFPFVYVHLCLVCFDAHFLVGRGRKAKCGARSP